MVVFPVLSDTQAAGVYPQNLYSLPDGGLAFASYCGRLGPGVFFLAQDGSLRRIAPLPHEPSCCDPRQGWYGGCRRLKALWAPKGTAFLYLDGDLAPILLGLADGSALWDVRELLAGASRFRWAGVKDGNGGK